MAKPKQTRFDRPDLPDGNPGKPQNTHDLIPGPAKNPANAQGRWLFPRDEWKDSDPRPRFDDSGEGQKKRSRNTSDTDAWTPSGS